MTMADVLTVTLIILGLLITLPALWLLLRALFPEPVDRSRARIAAAPVACFFLGLVPVLILFVGGGALLQKGGPGLKLVGFLFLLSGFLLGGIGLAGLSTMVGERLPSLSDEGRPWRGLVRGAVCMELAFLLPLVGWFGLLPLALVAGMGAALLGLLAPDSGTPAKDAPSPAAPVPSAA